MSGALKVAGLLLVLALHTELTTGRHLQAAVPVPAPAPSPAAAPLDVAADVFNGAPAPEGAFDFMVQMKAWMTDAATGEVAANHMCGGALLDSTTVLTAAHCLRLEDGSKVPVEALLLVINGIPYMASEVLVNTAYDPAALPRMNADFSDGMVDDPPTPISDVAVIKLAKPVPDAVTVALPDPAAKYSVGQVVEVAGWGRTSSAEGPASETLLFAQLQLVAPFDYANPGAPGTCPAPSFTDVLCATNVQSGANACQGDSGGPLVIRDYTTGAATVVGVVSHGPSCSEQNHGFYTDLRGYVAGLQAVMAGAQSEEAAAPAQAASI